LFSVVHYLDIDNFASTIFQFKMDFGFYVRSVGNFFWIFDKFY